MNLEGEEIWENRGNFLDFEKVILEELLVDKEENGSERKIGCVVETVEFRSSMSEEESSRCEV